MVSRVGGCEAEGDGIVRWKADAMKTEPYVPLGMSDVVKVGLMVLLTF